MKFEGNGKELTEEYKLSTLKMKFDVYQKENQPMQETLNEHHDTSNEFSLGLISLGISGGEAEPSFLNCTFVPDSSDLKSTQFSGEGIILQNVLKENSGAVTANRKDYEKEQNSSTDLCTVIDLLINCNENTKKKFEEDGVGKIIMHVR